MTTPTTVRALEYWLFQYRRTWRGTIVVTLLTPVLFLAAMGVGLGSYVKPGARASLGGADYLTFLAPGLLAVTAMQVAAGETMWPVMGAIKWTRVYHAMLASPLSIRDVWLGHFGWVGLRLLQTSAAFVVVTAAFGAAPGWGTALDVPAAVLTGLAFAAPVMAFAARQENDAGFSLLYRFAVVPLFLFSGAFFPVSQLPTALEWLAYLTPSWHGVELCRSLAFGTASAGAALGHAAYLTAWTVAGAVLALRSYRHRLGR